MSTITENYRHLNEQLHRDNDFYGRSGRKWAMDVMNLCEALSTQDVLDYGCGKSTLSENLPFKIHQYDPAIYKCNVRPFPADIVVCTDVLEHIEPELLDNVLKDIHQLTRKMAFLTIATRPAIKKLPDGRNAHLIVEDCEWWLNRLLKYFDLAMLKNIDKEIIVTVRPREKNGDDNHG